MEKCAECCGADAGTACTGVAAQLVDVSLPIKIKPSAVVGEIDTECCGEPVVTIRQSTCCGKGCHIIITQSICITIPVEFSADAEEGEISAVCRRACTGGCKEGKQI